MENFKTFFYGLETLQAVKNKYRELAKTYHPDTGGNEEQMKLLTAAFEWAAANIYRLAAMKYATEKGYDFDNCKTSSMAEILRQVVGLNCRLEIIGTWLYAFDAYSVKKELKELGFWFSVKHKAWIFNGRTKRRCRNFMNTDEIREKYGSEQINRPETPVLTVEKV